ncbi:hypothetical protein [Streptomyces sp. NBC_00078]|uniref:hypothetical protein n=1 Tax=unclassified Streptomyces TaxID=2593676 RepID=UPI00224FC0CC|nr:hypothetical protein [Streptomyces sp. NBC_00078]MCX5422863.1 hypothetical protein [Streptomyces sp. NBC_00078]
MLHLGQAHGGYADVRGTCSARPQVRISPRPLSAVTVPAVSIAVSTFAGLPDGGRPRLARGSLSVAGQDAAFTRKTLRSSKRARALRIWAVGREYRYREEGNRRHHVLERPESRIVMARSSWADPKNISGTAHGAVDSVDISLAILFEGVYTRNLSLRGALISAPGRLMDRLGD